jgi:hypothetical protein
MDGQTKACPFCGSANTEKRSDFGTSLMVAWHYCLQCRSSFESIKWGEPDDRLDLPAFLRRPAS